MVHPLLAAGIPVIVDTLGGALSQMRHPAAQTAAHSLSNLGEHLARGTIRGDDLVEANRHMETMAAIKAQGDGTALTQINETVRTEVASQDPYVRRMRPTFGYVVAVTWAVQMLALSYIIIVDTGSAIMVIESMSHMGAIWTVALSVLGIYVYKRSEDKKRILPKTYDFKTDNEVIQEHEALRNGPEEPKIIKRKKSYNS